MKIDEMTPRTRNINLKVRVMNLGETRMMSNGSTLAEGRVADDTGTILMSFWNEEIEKVAQGQSLLLRDARINLVNGSMRLSLGRDGDMQPADTPVETVREEPDLSALQYKQPRFTDRRSGPRGGGGGYRGGGGGHGGGHRGGGGYRGGGGQRGGRR